MVSEVVVRLDFDRQIVLGGQFFVWVSCATILDLFMQTLIVLLALGSRHISGVDLRLGVLKRVPFREALPTIATAFTYADSSVS